MAILLPFSKIRSSLVTFWPSAVLSLRGIQDGLHDERKGGAVRLCGWVGGARCAGTASKEVRRASGTLSHNSDTSSSTMLTCSSPKDAI